MSSQVQGIWLGVRLALSDTQSFCLSAPCERKVLSALQQVLGKFCGRSLFSCGDLAYRQL